jgi:hypothetical protein
MATKLMSRKVLLCWQLLGILFLGSCLAVPPAHAAASVPAHPFNSVSAETVHTVTSSNTIGNITLLYELGPNLVNYVLLVTPDWNPAGNCGCLDEPHPLAVQYTGVYWALVHEDGAPFSPGTTYNITASPNGWDGDIFYHTATTSNLVGGWTVLDNPVLNNNPHAVVMVTADLSPNGNCGCVMNNHHLGVWYTGSRWAIYNQDGASIPVGAQFNIFAAASSDNEMFTSSPASNNFSTDFVNDGRLNRHPEWLVFATLNWNPGGACGCQSDDHAIGVYYAPGLGEWAVYNEDTATIPLGTAFNLFVTPRNL